MVAQIRLVSSESVDRPCVLICDDEPLVVSALVRQLHRFNISCIADTSSEQVLELASKHRPAVIVLDIHQPNDGRDILMRLKKDPTTASCKVLVLSAVEDQFTRQTCLSLGAADYDTKPFDSCFIHKIARLVGVNPHAQEALPRRA